LAARTFEVARPRVRINISNGPMTSVITSSECCGTRGRGTAAWGGDGTGKIFADGRERGAY